MFLISLTPTGSEKVKGSFDCLSRVGEASDEWISEEEQKMLYSYLERMLCNLRNEEVSL